MEESSHPAVILLGHGSRVPDAGRHMEQVAEGLKRKYGYQIVEICYMSRLGPHFPETFAKCVDMGTRYVMVIPYFLHDGLHLVLDIPSMLQEVGRDYPHVKLVLGRNLGFDDTLVDLVERRIANSLDTGDVRELALGSRKDYPVPPGQCEFVPMLPDEAEKYLTQEDDHKHH